MSDKKYISARNKLIPFAERYANEKHGKAWNPYDHSRQTKESWTIDWNRTFLTEMDRLAKEQRI